MREFKMRDILWAFIEMYRHGREDRLEKSRVRAELNNCKAEKQKYAEEAARSQSRFLHESGKNDELRTQLTTLDGELTAANELSEHRSKTVEMYIPEMKKLQDQVHDLRIALAAHEDTIVRQNNVIQRQKAVLAEYRAIGKKTKR